jgi:hypothetical protein
VLVLVKKSLLDDDAVRDVHHPDPHAYDDIDDLPELPIPRPGERPAAASVPSPPIQAPSLGGGASFTAAGGEDPPPAAQSTPRAAPPTPASSPAPAPNPELAISALEQRRLATEQLTWEIAARLTSGLLANPSRGHASVKDAMGLFDQFLQEMHAYSRIATEFDMLESDQARRRIHGEYFHGAPGAAAGPDAPTPSPEQREPSNATPKPAPAKPRPMGDYRPIPPGTRGVYAPGSMAGPPPPADPPTTDDERAA